MYGVDSYRRPSFPSPSAWILLYPRTSPFQYHLSSYGRPASIISTTSPSPDFLSSPTLIIFPSSSQNKHHIVHTHRRKHPFLISFHSRCIQNTVFSHLPLFLPLWLPPHQLATLTMPNPWTGATPLPRYPFLLKPRDLSLCMPQVHLLGNTTRQSCSKCSTPWATSSSRLQPPRRQRRKQ